jgi:hypothetical protein
VKPSIASPATRSGPIGPIESGGQDSNLRSTDYEWRRNLSIRAKSGLAERITSKEFG